MSATVHPDSAGASHPTSSDPRRIIERAVAHLDHVLPGQAPILNFVHHNTLHGYQHLPFEEALAAFERLTGIRAYWPEEEFRGQYRAGRITDAGFGGGPGRTRRIAGRRRAGSPGRARNPSRGGVANLPDPRRGRPDAQSTRLADGRTRRHPPVSGGCPPTARQRLLEAATRDGVTGEREAVEDLWRACLASFQLPADGLHPEELVDLQLNLAKSLLARFKTRGAADEREPVVHQHMRAEAAALVERLFADVGAGVTLRGLLRTLTGQDLLDRVRPILIRLCAAHLDEGLAAWRLPERAEGLYAAWRRLAGSDPAWTLASWSGQRPAPARWPEDPVEAIAAELRRLGLPNRAGKVISPAWPWNCRAGPG